MEGGYLDSIKQAGFVDVELVSSVDVFAGAEGEGNARAFEAFGVNIRASKPAYVSTGPANCKPQFSRVPCLLRTAAVTKATIIVIEDHCPIGY